MDEDTTRIEVLAIDLAKHVFQVAGEDGDGRVVYEARLKSREAFWRFLERLPATVEVLMETGPGAQAWGRALQAREHRVRILPAQRVAEHRSGAKNDRKDAHALLRAGRDGSIAAVPIKRVEHLTMQALHRVRSGYTRRRTAISNQIRGLLIEHGIVIAKGDHALDLAVARLCTAAEEPVPARLRELAADLWAEWQSLGQRITALAEELGTVAATDAVAQRLMTVAGIGPLTASALACKDLRAERFANSRQFAAYFGVVPDQHSSGARFRLGKMSCRGDGYIRSLAIQGAHSVLRRIGPGGDPRLLRWKQRHGSKGAAVRLANRNLRIVYALLRDNSEYRRTERVMNPSA